jgi:hypothetical protein
MARARIQSGSAINGSAVRVMHGIIAQAEAGRIERVRCVLFSAG